MERRKELLFRLLWWAAATGVGWLALRYALVWLLPFLLALGAAALLEPLIETARRRLHLRRSFTAAVLTLRGPQTASELRANCERLHHFADASAVEGYLDELAARESGALAVRLPRQPGAREPRWAHLLCGEAPAPVVDAIGAAQGPSDLIARVERLEREVAELRARLAEVAGHAGGNVAERDEAP